MSKTVIIVISILLVICCCAAIVGGIVLFGGVAAIQGAISGVTGVYQENTKVADSFLNDLKSGDYESAYALCSPDMKEALGGPSGLKDFVDGLGAAPDTWSYSGFEMKSDAAVGSFLELTGKVTLTDGTVTDLTIQMKQSGSNWEIQYLHIGS